LIAVFALACGRGPETETLQQEVQRRLDAGFEAGLFRILDLQRTGTAPFRDLEAGRSGLFVYYQTHLELQRDYSLTSWRGLNLGTLAYVAGATPSGVEGFEAAGNDRGDVLRVNGRMAWHEVEHEWLPLEREPLPKEARAHQPVEGTGPESLLSRVRELVASRPVPFPETHEEAIVYELRRATELIDLRVAREAGAVTLGTGQASGTYHDFGKAFAHHSTEQGLAVHPHPTEGSVENGFEIQARQLDFGLVQSDVAEALFEGVQESQLPLPGLRGVASLWPEVVHIVTLETSGIRTLRDLKDHRLAVGRLGSGTRLNAVLLGRAAGLDHGDFPIMREVSVTESIAQLEAGELDAIFVTEAVPSRALQDLTQRRDDVRFVAVEPSQLDTLTEEHFAYYALTIPARTYPGQEEPFRALALAAMLVTHEHTPDAVVSRMLEMLLEGSDALSKAYYRAAFISRETVRLGMALPLHPAAAAFYMRRTGAQNDPVTDEPD